VNSKTKLALSNAASARVSKTTVVVEGPTELRLMNEVCLSVFVCLSVCLSVSLCVCLRLVPVLLVCLLLVCLLVSRTAVVVKRPAELRLCCMFVCLCCLFCVLVCVYVCLSVVGLLFAFLFVFACLHLFVCLCLCLAICVCQVYLSLSFSLSVCLIVVCLSVHLVHLCCLCVLFLYPSYLSFVVCLSVGSLFVSLCPTFCSCQFKGGTSRASGCSHTGAGISTIDSI